MARPGSGDVLTALRPLERGGSLQLQERQHWARHRPKSFSQITDRADCADRSARYTSRPNGVARAERPSQGTGAHPIAGGDVMAEQSGNQGNQEFPTVLGPDSAFKGEMSFEKGLRLMGRFEGKIATPGRLHIAREAKMQADVEAGAIMVEGDVRGNLTANDR